MRRGGAQRKRRRFSEQAGRSSRPRSAEADFSCYRAKRKARAEAELGPKDESDPKMAD